MLMDGFDNLFLIKSRRKEVINSLGLGRTSFTVTLRKRNTREMRNTLSKKTSKTVMTGAHENLQAIQI